jgi:hypothetical protein
MTATDISEAELDRLEGLYAAAHFLEQPFGTSISVLHDRMAQRSECTREVLAAFPALLAAARALPAEIRAREEAERDEKIAIVRAGAAEARAIGAEQRLYDTIVAAMGGEDVPGSATAVMPADVERAMRSRDEAFNYERDRATAAEQRAEEAENRLKLAEDIAFRVVTERNAAEQRVKALEEALVPFAEFAEWVAVERPGWDHDGFALVYGASLEKPLLLAPFRRAAAIRARSTQEKSND